MAILPVPRVAASLEASVLLALPLLAITVAGVSRIFLNQSKYHAEQEEGTLFIVNNGVEPHGNVINVSCIGIGQSSTNLGYSYYLLVKNGGSSLMLKSYTGFVPAWVEHTSPSWFLVVPSDLVGSCGKLKLELNISGKPF
ncbi:hypothetical protein Vadar_030196 [Vaccinium darrowii]|uniref:Uncharacterized protein n=1 Tax=Vaccinium darrowii TaxID=229202 RepID=A0ACB7YH14_9ERIC|nr:hypothetical protein Vadar_030196 [Vaccinium darrowii]